MRCLHLLSLFLVIMILTGCTNLQRNLSNFFFPPNWNSDIRDGESVTLKLEHKTPRGEVEDKRDPALKKALKEEKCGNAKNAAEANLTKLTVSNDERKTSQTEINKEYDECMKQDEHKFAFAAAPLAIAATGVALEEVQKFLKAEAERYTATYSGVVVDDIFYNDWTPDADINLMSFTVKRTIKDTPNKDKWSLWPKKGKEARTAEDAMEFCMAVEPTLDKSAFRLIPVYVQVHKAKAKLIAFDWLAPLGFDLLAPWSAFSKETRGFDNDVDVNVEVTLNGVWVDDKQELHNKVLAKQELQLGNIELSQDAGKGRFMLSPKEAKKTDAERAIEKFKCEYLTHKKVTKGDHNVEKTELAIKKDAVSDDESKIVVEDYFDFPPSSNTYLFQAVPRSTRAKDSKFLGTGNYILSVLVTERDNHGERVKEIASKIEGQKEGILKGVGKLFE